MIKRCTQNQRNVYIAASVEKYSVGGSIKQTLHEVANDSPHLASGSCSFRSEKKNIKN